MNDIQASIPSVKSLVVACVAASFLAGVILTVAVLPAEYGIDPTGLGQKMGLTALAKTTQASQDVAAVSCAPANSTDANASQWQDSVQITVPAGKGLEYKFHLAKGASMEYSWTSNGAKLYFDFHGEPQGDTSGYFKSYQESTDHQASGAFTAPFDGSHGWYWENKSPAAVTIILNTKGTYRVLGLM